MHRSLRSSFSLCALLLIISAHLNLLSVSYNSPPLDTASLVALDPHGIPIWDTLRSCAGLMSCGHQYCKLELKPSSGILFSSSVGADRCSSTTWDLLIAHYDAFPRIAVVGWISTLLFAVSSLFLAVVPVKAFFVADLLNRLLGAASLVLLVAYLQLDASIFPLNQEIQLLLLVVFLLCLVFGGLAPSCRRPKKQKTLQKC